MSAPGDKSTEKTVDEVEGDGDKKLESKLTQTFLNLERIDPLLYRSTHLFKPVFGRAVFGGQVVGQALVAASNTAPTDRRVHSLHCYFLRPGSVEEPILYHVTDIRNGGTYSNRFVNATQQGRSIFTMMVSFKLPETDNFSHQFKMPDAPPPEELAETNDILKLRLGTDIGERERDYIQNRLSEEMAILRKPVDPNSYFGSSPIPARQCVWMKVNGHIGPNQVMQNCAAAYISDSMLIGTALLPWGDKYRNSKFFMTSLDHAIWFHHPVKADEWLLYEMESPQCGEGRCMSLGRMWDRQGNLKLSVSQEGMLRTGPFKSREGACPGSDLGKGRNSSPVSGPGGSSSQPQKKSATEGSIMMPATQDQKILGSRVFKRFFHAARNVARFVH